MTKGQMLFEATRRPTQRGEWSLLGDSEKGHFESAAVRYEEALATVVNENACDACMGAGSDPDCMCGGSGKMSQAARYLRETVIKLIRERDEARLQVRELESRLGNTEAKLESASVVEHKAVEALVTAEHERDEARNAMHRREEEVVAARCERDEARAQLADVAARQRLDTAGAACAALTDLAYGAEEAVHVRDVLMARPLVTDDARDLTGKEVES